MVQPLAETEFDAMDSSLIELRLLANEKGNFPAGQRKSRPW
jgi:hypothetical protein